MLATILLTGFSGLNPDLLLIYLLLGAILFGLSYAEDLKQLFTRIIKKAKKTSLFNH